MLASEATDIVLVRLVQAGQPNGTGFTRGTVLTVEKTLQSDYNHQAVDGPPDPTDIEGGLTPDMGFSSGQEYILFMSFDRGGSCLSAAWTYGGPNSTLHLLTNRSDFGPDAPRGYQLNTGFLTMPTAISYSDLVRRLSPTGGALYASNTGESWCPGP